MESLFVLKTPITYKPIPDESSTTDVAPDAVEQPPATRGKKKVKFSSQPPVPAQCPSESSAPADKGDISFVKLYNEVYQRSDAYSYPAFTFAHQGTSECSRARSNSSITTVYEGNLTPNKHHTMYDGRSGDLREVYKRHK